MFAASLVGYMSGEVAGRDVDHDDDDDDDDEKGQWNRSIASLRSELHPTSVHFEFALGGGGARLPPRSLLLCSHLDRLTVVNLLPTYVRDDQLGAVAGCCRRMERRKIASHLPSIRESKNRSQ